MDRLHEIIGRLRDEEYDAVLYGVMLRFLKNESKKTGLHITELLIGIDEESRQVDTYNEDGGFMHSLNINEA